MAVLRYKSGGNWYDLTVGMDQATADARYVNITGDTMSDDLNMSGAAGVHLSAATAQAGLSAYSGGAAIISKDGSAFQPLFVADPTLADHAATKKYTDRAIPYGWVHWGSSTRAAGWSRLVNADNYTVQGGMTYSNQALFPPTAGKYLVTYTVEYTVIGNAGGAAPGSVTSSGLEGMTYIETTNHAHTFSGSTMFDLTAGTGVGLWTYQGGGATVSQAYLFMARIGT